MTRFQFVLALFSPVLAFFGFKKIPFASYNSTWTVTGGQAGKLAALQSKYYSKKVLDRLQKKFVFRVPLDAIETLPRKNGEAIQFFRYENFSGHGV